MLLGWSRTIGLVAGTMLTVGLCFLIGWNGFVVPAFHANTLDLMNTVDLVLGLTPFVAAVWALREAKE